MTKNIAVRSMLVDENTGKYIKAIDERGLDDFLQLITTSPKDGSIIFFDFSNIIEHFNSLLNNTLNQHEDKELLIQKNTIFNFWQRFKTFTNESTKNDAATKLMYECETTLSLINTRIPDLYSDYYHRTNDSAPNYYPNDKKTKLEKLIKEIDVSIEILLCNIHVTATVDILSFKNDTILSGHCIDIHTLLLTCIHSEIGYYNNFHYDSLIYQCCMEDMGIFPDILLKICNINTNAEKIKHEIMKNSVLSDECDEHNNEVFRVKKIKWSKACNHKLERTKMLLIVMQKVLALIDLIERLKNNDVVFNEDQKAKENFEQEISSLIDSKTKSLQKY
jgi:hypothetical protein